MTDPADAGADLGAALDLCWTRLAALPAEVTLATVAPRGAEARVVMLRRADRATGSVTFHADLRGPKLAEIGQTPGATLLLWDRAARLQLRLRARLTASTGAVDLWSALPGPARDNYGTVPPPGTPIPAPEAYHRQPDPARFGEISARIDEIDLVDLSGPTDRRALFRRTESWAGIWLAP